MAILYCAAEDIDFPNFPYTIFSFTNANGSYYRSTYSRGYIYPYNALGVYATSKIFPGGALTSFWIHGQVYFNPSANRFVLGVVDQATANYGIYCGLGSANTKVALLKNTSGGMSTISEQSVGTFPAVSALHSWDMQISSYGANGTAKIYIDGVEALSYGPADITVSGVTNLNAIGIWGHSSVICHSEMIVADEDTRAMSLNTLVPNGETGTHDWTGTYADIDELAKSDADLIYTNTNDTVHQVDLTATPAGSFQVLAAMISARCIKGSGSTPTKVKLGVKSGGSADDGTGQDLTTTWDTYNRLMTVNPVTTNPFTTAELDALLLQLKSAA